MYIAFISCVAIALYIVVGCNVIGEEFSNRMHGHGYAWSGINWIGIGFVFLAWPFFALKFIWDRR